MALHYLMVYVDHDLTQYMHTILSFVWTQYFFLIGNHSVEVAEKVQLSLCWNDQMDNANVSVRRWFLRTVVQIQKSHKHQESLKAVSWFVFGDCSIIWALLQRPAPGPSSLRACLIPAISWYRCTRLWAAPYFKDIILKWAWPSFYCLYKYFEIDYLIYKFVHELLSFAFLLVPPVIKMSMGLNFFYHRWWL